MQAFLRSVLIVLALCFAMPAFVATAAENTNADCAETEIDPAQYVDAIRAKIDQGGVGALDAFELFFVKNHEKALDARLDSGLDPNACGGPFSASLLGTAAQLGLTDDVRILLQHGANLERPKSARGESALISAIYANAYDAADVLIKSGADVQAASGNAFQGNALSALAMAFNDKARDEEKEAHLARELMAGGVSPNAKDKNPLYGMTPLMNAIVLDKPSLVRLFLQCGADPHIQDNKGRDAFALAQSLKRATILDILQSHPMPGACAAEG